MPRKPRQEFVQAFHAACERSMQEYEHQHLLQALQEFLTLRSFDRLATATLDVLPTKELRAEVIPPLLDLMPPRDGKELQSTLKRHLADRKRAGVGLPRNHSAHSTFSNHSQHSQLSQRSGGSTGSTGSSNTNSSTTKARSRWRGFTLSLSRKRQNISSSTCNSSSSAGVHGADMAASTSFRTYGAPGNSSTITSKGSVERARSQTLDPGSYRRRQKGRRMFSLSRSDRSRSSTQPRPRRVKVQRNKYGTLGFNMRGGAEYGMGLYVSKVDVDGPAARAGLCAGDEILTVNGTSISGIRHAEAVQLIKGAKKVRLEVISTGRVPKRVNVQETFEWLAAAQQGPKAAVPANTAVSGSAHGPEGDAGATELRRVNFAAGPEGLGMSVCGGHDQGVGIYISAVDIGGLAHQHGLKAGDQVCDVNGVDFDLLTHEEAVKVLTAHDHVFMTIKPGHYIPRHRYVMDATEWLSVGQNKHQPAQPPLKSILGDASVSPVITTRTTSSSPSRTTSLSSTGNTASPQPIRRINTMPVDTEHGSGGVAARGRSLRGGLDGQAHARPQQATLATHLLSLGQETRVDAADECLTNNSSTYDDGGNEFDFETHETGRPRSNTAPSAYRRRPQVPDAGPVGQSSEDQSHKRSAQDHDNTQEAAQGEEWPLTGMTTASGPVHDPLEPSEERSRDGTQLTHATLSLSLNDESPIAEKVRTGRRGSNGRVLPSTPKPTVQQQAMASARDNASQDGTSREQGNHSDAASTVRFRQHEAGSGRRNGAQRRSSTAESIYGFDNMSSMDAPGVLLRANKPASNRTSKAMSTSSASSSLSFLDRTLAIAQEWAKQAPLEEEPEHDRIAVHLDDASGQEQDMHMVTVPKGGKPLGLVVTGGCDVASTGGRVLIHQMTPGGSFAELGDDEARIGDEVYLVNGRSLTDLKHKEAVQTIVDILKDKSTDSMTFGLRRLETSDL